jgi:general secretion pathway protein C
VEGRCGPGVLVWFAVSMATAACAPAARSVARDEVLISPEGAHDDEGGAGTRARKRRPTGADEGKIRLVGRDTYEVVNDVFEALVERGRGAEGAKATVVESDGLAIGLLLSGVRRGSVLEALGLENDDLIESINGFPVGVAEGRRRAYAAVRAGVRVSVIVLRRGEHRLLEYTVVYF